MNEFWQPTVCNRVIGWFIVLLKIANKVHLQYSQRRKVNINIIGFDLVISQHIHISKHIVYLNTMYCFFYFTLIKLKKKFRRKISPKSFEMCSWFLIINNGAIPWGWNKMFKSYSLCTLWWLEWAWTYWLIDLNVWFLVGTTV